MKKAREIGVTEWFLNKHNVEVKTIVKQNICIIHGGRLNSLSVTWLVYTTDVSMMWQTYLPKSFRLVPFPTPYIPHIWVFHLLYQSVTVGNPWNTVKTSITVILYPAVISNMNIDITWKSIEIKSIQTQQNHVLSCTLFYGNSCLAIPFPNPPTFFLFLSPNPKTQQPSPARDGSPCPPSNPSHGCSTPTNPWRWSFHDALHPKSWCYLRPKLLQQKVSC